MNDSGKTGHKYINKRKPGKRDGANCAPYQVAINTGGGKNPDKPTLHKRVQTLEEAIAVRDTFLADQVQDAGLVQLKQANHPKSVRKAALNVRARELRFELAELERKEREVGFGWIYLVGEEGSSMAVKIGKTFLDPPEARLSSLQTGNPRKLIMLAAKHGSEFGCGADERILHAKYIEQNEWYGEWFTPTKEMFAEFDLGWPYIDGEVATIGTT